MCILPNVPLDPLPLFCDVDDFWKRYEPIWKANQVNDGVSHRNRARSLCPSEIMTILIAFHQSHYRDFKAFYLGYVWQHWKAEFPRLVSYSRFIEYVPSVIRPLFDYLQSLLGSCSGISFVDSTDLAVCHNRRIKQHKVFKGIAERGKTSTGWFYGFKLHLIVSDTGELLNFTVTPGNVEDRKPVPALAQGLFGKIFGDKGYISRKLSDLLMSSGVQIITKLKRNMKGKLMLFADRILLRKRAVIESINDQLKNISQVEHTRHRAYTGFLWNVAAALIAYCHQPKKPSIYNPEQVSLDLA